MSETKASANKEKKYGMNKERVELRAEIREVLFDQAYSINVRGYEGDALNKIEAIFEAHTKQGIAEVLERVNNTIITELESQEDSDFATVHNIINKELEALNE